MKPTESNASDIRTIFKTKEFDEFFDYLDKRTQGKFEYTFNVVQTVYVLPVKHIKRLEKTDLYEMRVSVGTNEYRTILFAMDHDNVIQATKIILLNGFLKKSNKDYGKQIIKAQRILNDLIL